MASIVTSIVIPVYNKWDLTRNCLKSLAETIDLEKNEVIIIDNASDDVTPEACVFLGKRLFGENFGYIRNEQNRNFAGASNQGAQIAKGEFLLFLNNDTKAEGRLWLENLLEDFKTYPGIAATGPVLLYPQVGSFGRQVQHLGVLVSPFMKFGHLYQGIPETSTLARKRRFFQAITAACMLMPKSLFNQTGRFDENFVNGFEDVDLCGRLRHEGYEFTVNPEVTLFHYESQSPGRHKEGNTNYALLQKNSLKFFSPDFEKLLNADNLDLKLNEWLNLEIKLKPEIEVELEEKLHGMDKEKLKDKLIEVIYWEKGWKRYLELCENDPDYLDSFKIYFNLFKNVPNASVAFRLAEKFRDKDLRKMAEIFLRIFNEKPEVLYANAQTVLQICRHFELGKLAGQFSAWLVNYDIFLKTVYPYYQNNYFSVIGK